MENPQIPHLEDAPPETNRPVEIVSAREKMKNISLDSIHWFMGISAVSAVANAYTTAVAGNALSPMGTVMNGYDLVMGGMAHHSESLDAQAVTLSASESARLRWRASRWRESASIGHIIVAGAGATAAMPVATTQTPSTAGLLVTLSTAIVGGGVALKERHDVRKLGEPDRPNLAQRMGRRLLMTKFVESSLTVGGLTTTLATGSETPSKAAALGILVGVGGYMVAQIRDEHHARDNIESSLSIQAD